jgi:hypothetical protein
MSKTPNTIFTTWTTHSLKLPLTVLFLSHPSSQSHIHAPSSAHLELLPLSNRKPFDILQQTIAMLQPLNIFRTRPLGEEEGDENSKWKWDCYVSDREHGW